MRWRTLWAIGGVVVGCSPPSRTTVVEHEVTTPPPVPAPSVTTPTAAPRDEVPAPRHTLGPLALGLTEAAVRDAVGDPASAPELVEEAATGLSIARWSYPALGLELALARESDDAPWELARMTARAPSTLETNRKVGIGSRRVRVDEVYGPDYDEDTPPTEDTVVVDSIYGGVVFTFEEGRVDSIFVGAAAE